MKYLDQKTKDRIESKKKILDSFRPLPQSLVLKLHEQFQLEMTYNSNAIEGNTLTLKETFLVINEGITVKGKSFKDHVEAKDHQLALEYLYSLLDSKKNTGLSELLIRDIHKIVMQDSDKDWSGRYRDRNVRITGSSHTPPEAFEVPIQMNELITWIQNTNTKDLDTIERSSILHHKLTHIHPFFDGNGRTSRIIMNVLLMQDGFPLSIILKNDRKKYYQVLQKADKGEYTPLVQFIARSVERSLDIYLKIIRPQQKKEEQYIPLSQLAPMTPYSAKYLNLLIRKNKLEAHKEGRNWLSSEKAVKDYTEGRKRKRK